MPTDVTGWQRSAIYGQTMERLERQQTQLEVDALWDASFYFTGPILIRHNN